MKNLATFLILGLLAGCSGDDFGDLRAFMEEAGKGSQPSLEPMPPVMVVENNVYDDVNLVDPFKPRSMKPAKSGGGRQPDLNRPKGPMESFPLDALKMVGTLEKGGALFALIKTPDNSLYRVKKGDYIGQNYGRIISISMAGIELTETIQDGTGDWVESKANVALQE